ncbi:MAG: hypothetical protein ABSG22_10595 [Sedimentisphaerales bacterium]
MAGQTQRPELVRDTMMKKLLMSLFFVLVLAGTTSSYPLSCFWGKATTVSDTNDPNIVVTEMKYKKILVPTGDIGTDWRTNYDYNDSAWTAGYGGVGYCTDPCDAYYQWIGNDVLTTMHNINGTCYIRIPFEITSLDAVTGLSLLMRYDDGFAAYINGTLVKYINKPTTPVWNSLATQASAETTSAWNTYDISTYVNQLTVGHNLLAIQGLNDSNSSSDFLICSKLVLVK